MRKTFITNFALFHLLIALTFSTSQASEVSPQLRTLQQQIVGTVAKVQDSVLAIVLKQNGETVGSGSGVIVTEDGIIFTAAHVVEGNQFAEAILSDGTSHKIEVLGMNLFKDAAICRFVEQGRKWPFSPAGNSDESDVTTRVIAMGHGRGYDERRSAPVRFGRIRAHNPGRFLTTDCPLIGGDSGGPLFNLKGEVIGINSSINGLARFNVHAGVSGFKDDYARMLKGERWGILLPNVLLNAETPVVGVEWSPTSNDPRPIVWNTPPKSPANKAGIRAGDLIISIDGEKVQTKKDVHIEIGRKIPGNTIEMVVNRKGSLVEAKITLIARGSVETQDSIAAPPIGTSEDSPFVREKDKPRLAKQQQQLLHWAAPLAERLGDSYIEIYSQNDLTKPLLNATIIDDEIALAPLSSFIAIPYDVLAWKPGTDSYPIELIGGYEEHDLAVLKIPGLKAKKKLLTETKKAELGEFILAISNDNNKDSVIRMGVVSVEQRFLKAFFGVSGDKEQVGEGAIITSVSSGEAAAKMGIRKGDIVTKFNGKTIKGFGKLVEVINSLKVGDEVTVDYIRNGQQKTAKSTLGVRSSNSARIEMMDQLGDNSLSRNTDNFQTVIQSDILVEPHECGAPVFDLNGLFLGIAISDAGRNKSYIIPAEVINKSLQTEPRKVDLKVKVKPTTSRRQITLEPRGISPSDLEELQRLQQEQLERLFNESQNDAFDLFKELEGFFGR